MNVNNIDKFKYNQVIHNKKSKEDIKSDSTGFADKFFKSVSEDNEADDRQNINVGAGGNIAMQNGSINIKRLFQADDIAPCDVMGIESKDSDFVLQDIVNGCVYKAKMISDCQAYVEKKSDDGNVDGYIVDVAGIENKVAEASEESVGIYRAAAGAADAAEIKQADNDSQEDYDVKAAFHDAFLKFYDYVQDRIENGPPKFCIGSSEMTVEEWDNMLEKVDEQLDEIKEETRERVEKLKQDDLKNKCGYFALADKNGIISYNGGIFVCDYQNNAICLGDMSNSKNVLTIPLSAGGCLMVNRNSIGALGRLIGMFSAEDQGRIMRAIAEDAQLQRNEKAIDDMENDIADETGTV